MPPSRSTRRMRSCTTRDEGRSRDYRGRDEIRSFFAQIGERTGGSFSATHEALFSGEGQAAVLVSLVAERNGERHEWKAVDVIRVEDGLIAYHRTFEGDQYSLDEWWS